MRYILTAPEQDKFEINLRKVSSGNFVEINRCSRHGNHGSMDSRIAKKITKID